MSENAMEGKETLERHVLNVLTGLKFDDTDAHAYEQRKAQVRGGLEKHMTPSMLHAFEVVVNQLLLRARNDSGLQSAHVFTNADAVNRLNRLTEWEQWLAARKKK